MEAIWVAAEMRAGGAYAHSALALDTIGHHGTVPAADPEKVAHRAEAQSEQNAVRLEIS